MKSNKIVWRDYAMQDVIDVFTKGLQFELSEGVTSKRLSRADWFYDCAKQRVVLRLFVEEEYK